MVEHASLNPAPGHGDDREGGPPGVLAVMRRWRWMIVLAAVAAGAVGYIVASSGSPSYEARAVLLVGPINTDNADTLKASGQLAQTYAQLATSRPVLAATSRRLGGVRNIGNSVSASANAVTRLLTVTVSTRDPQLGARIANTEARTLIDIAAQGQAAVIGAPAQGAPTPKAGASESGSLRLVDPAEASSAPSGRSAVGIAIIAAVGGLLGALGLALLLDRSGDSITDLDELRSVTGSGVLATMSPATLASHRRHVGHRSEVDREFRLLAAKLNAIGERSLLVVVLDADGLAFTTHLAEALVATGGSVAVVDAGHSRIGAAREAVPADAPVNVLAAGDQDDDELPLRFVRPAAGDVAHGAESARGMIDDLLGSANTVLVTAPSLQSSPTALTWARVVDGTVLVLGLERTGRGQVTAVVENLRLVHARILGTVVASGSRSLRR